MTNCTTPNCGGQMFELPDGSKLCFLCGRGGVPPRLATRDDRRRMRKSRYALPTPLTLEKSPSMLELVPLQQRGGQGASGSVS